MDGRDILPSVPTWAAPGPPAEPPPWVISPADGPAYGPPAYGQAGPWPPARRGLRPRSWVLVGALCTALLLAGWAAAGPGQAPADAAPGGSPTSYAFLATDPRSGAPVGFDPCETEIHYVLRPDGSPPGGDAIVAEAFAEASRVTGFTFVLDGYTTTGPIGSRPALFAEQNEPVLVAWSTQAESPDLAETVVGWASSDQAPSLHGGSAYRTGQVVLDAEDLAPELDRRGGRAEVRAVVLHEIGHLLGLDHVDDPSQIMDEYSSPDVTTYQAGDLAGLEALGTGRCTGP